MYVSDNGVFTQAGIATFGNGELVASAGLMNLTVIVTTLTTVSGAPTVSLDALLGDTQNVNLGGNPTSSFPAALIVQGQAWALGAIATGLVVPATPLASVSATIVGVWRGVRVNVTWGTPGGSFLVQIAARDSN